MEDSLKKAIGLLRKNEMELLQLISSMKDGKQAFYPIEKYHQDLNDLKVAINDLEKFQNKLQANKKTSN